MFYLRELQKSDLCLINKWRNNPELIKLLGAPFRYVNLTVDEQWFEAYMSNRGNSIRCTIVEKNSGEIIGLVSLLSIDYINRSAEFHIMIGEYEKRRKGAGTFAVNTMLQHAFNNMNLQRVELLVLENNLAAQHLYEKVGFVREGIKRKVIFKNNEYMDMYLYSILKDEYKYKMFGGGGRGKISS